MLLAYGIHKDGSWTIRVDAPHGNQPYHRRHVHICKKGLKGAYPWNEDGTRHDKHRFPPSEQSIVAAKRYAAEALGVDADSLSLITSISGGVRVSVLASDTPTERRRSIFSSYLRIKETLVIFGTERGLVLTITEAIDEQRQIKRQKKSA